METSEQKKYALVYDPVKDEETVLILIKTMTEAEAKEWGRRLRERRDNRSKAPA